MSQIHQLVVYTRDLREMSEASAILLSYLHESLEGMKSVCRKDLHSNDTRFPTDVIQGVLAELNQGTVMLTVEIVKEELGMSAFKQRRCLQELKALKKLDWEVKGKPPEKVYPHPWKLPQEDDGDVLKITA